MLWTFVIEWPYGLCEAWLRGHDVSRTDLTCIMTPCVQWVIVWRTITHPATHIDILVHICHNMADWLHIGILIWNMPSCNHSRPFMTHDVTRPYLNGCCNACSCLMRCCGVWNVWHCFHTQLSVVAKFVDPYYTTPPTPLTPSTMFVTSHVVRTHIYIYIQISRLLLYGLIL